MGSGVCYNCRVKKKLSTKDQRADLFTKALPGPTFLKFREEMMHLP